ncbi:hydroxymethylglutaryl-CoA lyase [Deltaproteobacteria bacterium OttesenSCG-928-K17]|nr:hydroxymethylglutaryl-CoA lyase [Deltaproteobacteria bacterium OttesenSCG-928-K17]
MSLPEKVSIVELAPRDGFQSIKPWIDTGGKIKVAEMLLAAGVDEIEATSFVSPKAIEQMKDAPEVIAALLPKVDSGRIIALAPNLKGVANAAAAGVRKAALVISASEAHNRNNVRRSPAESLDELEVIRRDFPQMHIKLDVATVFGCPFTGEVPQKDITFVIDRAVELGVLDVALCDTVGVASPMQTRRLLADLMDRYGGRPINWALHMHNTRGLAAANTLVALEMGLNRFETAAGGLGGCPFAPGASGNMATEDLVFMLQEMGVKTNVDLSRVLDCAEYMKDVLGLQLDSKISRQTMNKVTGRDCRTPEGQGVAAVQ